MFRKAKAAVASPRPSGSATGTACDCCGGHRRQFVDRLRHSGSPGHKAQIKTDANATATATTAAATTAVTSTDAATTAKADVQAVATQADATPVTPQTGTAATANGAAATAVATKVSGVAPKATSLKTAGTDTAVETPASGDAVAASDPSAAAASAGAAGKTAAQQPGAAGKPKAADGAVDTDDTTGASPAAATAISPHEHSPATGAGNIPANTADAGAQASALMQPQAGTTANTVAPAGALTVTAASHAAVPLSGLAIEIAVSAQSGKSRFEIRLDPADLGRIDVRIDVDSNGQVTSHLTVEKPETLSMLQPGRPATAAGAGRCRPQDRRWRAAIQSARPVFFRPEQRQRNRPQRAAAGHQRRRHRPRLGRGTNLWPHARIEQRRRYQRLRRRTWQQQRCKPGRLGNDAAAEPHASGTSAAAANALASPADCRQLSELSDSC